MIENRVMRLNYMHNNFMIYFFFFFVFLFSVVVVKACSESIDLYTAITFTQTAITGKCRGGEKVIAQHKSNYCISSKLQNCSYLHGAPFIHSCSLCMLKKLQFFTHSFKRWQLTATTSSGISDAAVLKGHWNLFKK